MASHNPVPHTNSDSLFQVLLAYDEKRISADVAAKAIVDEARRTHTTVAFEMDAPLQEAVAREMRSRREARPADDTGPP